ncbi:MAG: NAD-dependent epimerase/dehydratase family protein [Ignavibacteriae bacterium]|nr:NAD-dependent epimerase/dehydratase family protein [Ignavibacteriota bacterium]
MKKKILILGGSGFVGKNVTEVFSDSGNQIFSASRSNGTDLTDYDKAVMCFQENKPDIIVNLAAFVGSLNYVTKQAAEIFDVNMRMLLNIFKAIQFVLPKSTLINPIANCAYPGNLENYSEERFWEGKIHQSVLSYGSTRRMIDVLSNCYDMQYGLRTINFFVPNMYGPNDSTNPDKAHALNALVSKVVKAIKENKNEIEVWGSGIAIREWLYAKDFARFLLEVINKENDFGLSESVNVAQNFGLSVRELVDLIIKKTGFKGKILWNRAMPDGAPRKVMNDTRFKKIFTDFRFTDFKTGIKETIKFYQSVYPY